jgi:hypothetical protein
MKTIYNITHFLVACTAGFEISIINAFAYISNFII